MSLVNLKTISRIPRITGPKTTLYRHLKQAGATRLRLGVCSKKVRKRWSCDHTHDHRVGDFAEGSYIKQGDQAHKAYLSAYIETHSRFVVEARYYLNQNLQILADTLIRAHTT